LKYLRHQKKKKKNKKKKKKKRNRPEREESYGGVFVDHQNTTLRRWNHIPGVARD
jgi:hypothetical protein